MARLNFGISAFTRRFLKPNLQIGRQIEVPESGELPCVSSIGIKYRNPDQANPRKYNFFNYTDPRESKYTTLSAVNFDIIRSLSFDGLGVRSEDILLIWIKERQEWVAIKHKQWPDKSLSMNPYTNESEEGPYSLDDYCKNIIRNVYGISLDHPEDPSKIEPSRLERIIS